MESWKTGMSRGTAVSQGRTLTDLDVFRQVAQNARDTGVQSERLFDATLQVLELSGILRRARPVWVTENGVHFVEQFLLLFRMFGDAVHEPGHSWSCRVVSLVHLSNIQIYSNFRMKFVNLIKIHNTQCNSRIPLTCTSFDSSLNALSKVFWPQLDQTKHSK